MANSYQCTKFDENLHWQPEYDQKSQFKMAAAVILTFAKSGIKMGVKRHFQAS